MAEGRHSGKIWPVSSRQPRMPIISAACEIIAMAQTLNFAPARERRRARW